MSDKSTSPCWASRIWMGIRKTCSSFFTASQNQSTTTVWSQHGSYPLRSGNEVQIFIDGQAAYSEIAAAFHNAKKFIYTTISFGSQDFLLVPENGEVFFDILRSCSHAGVDVRMVVWQRALNSTQDTIPDPSPGQIPGVNAGPGSIQARWDKAPGFNGRYSSPHALFKPVDMNISADMGCHHQKTYIMDDGIGGVVAFVGGINPVQAYWDTPLHDSLDVRRVAKGRDPLTELKAIPPLHDIFYRIKGPAVADVIANFVERYNGASIRHVDVTTDAVALFTADQIQPVRNGIEVQVLRTIAPNTYTSTQAGDKGIRELYLNALSAAGAGSLVYIENQYFFDHGIISEIHAAAERGAKIIALLTSKPDEGEPTAKVEDLLETVAYDRQEFQLVASHNNVALLTLGNSRPDPRTSGKYINSETYIHSKTMAVFGPNWAVMTGGSANIAFTSMQFHSEMNIAFMDTAKIANWVAQLWSEHLQISVEDALQLIGKPADAFNAFKGQAINNKANAALDTGLRPEGHVFDWKGTDFPPRNLDGINLALVSVGGVM